MLLTRDFQSKELTTFPGPNLLRDPEDTTDIGARIAKNVEYFDGSVQTRHGYASAFNPSLAIQRMFHWFQTAVSRLYYFSTNSGAPKVSARELVAGTNADIITGLDATAVTASFALFASRLISCFLDADGDGVDQGRIVAYISGSPAADMLFQRPLTATNIVGPPALSKEIEVLAYNSDAGGVVTHGTHFFKIVFKTRTGYETRAIGLLSGITATGQKSAEVSIITVFINGGLWPDWVVGAKLLMSTAVAPNGPYYFVPENNGGVVDITPGSLSAVTFIANISDDELVQQQDGAAWDQLITMGPFGLYSGDSSIATDSPPFSPRLVLEYSNRMVYICALPDEGSSDADVSTLFISEPGLPQFITADQHVQHLPGYRKIVSAAVLGDILYIFGPSWTYEFIDNGDIPVSWAEARLVDNAIGTTQPHGVVTNSSRDKAWVAHTDGLYILSGGVYATRPVSYYQTSDWERINWTAPQGTIQIVDDANHHMVRVIAPLDEATAPTHMLCWDYKDGDDFSSVKYTLDNFSSPANPGSLCIVQNPAANVPETWMSDNSAGKVYRHKSAHAGDAANALYNDDSAGIDSQYRTPPLPDISPTPWYFGALWSRIKGSGSAVLKAYNLGEARSVSLTAATLTAAPESYFKRFFRMQSEAVYLDITNGAVADSWFSLSSVICWFKRWIAQRI